MTADHAIDILRKTGAAKSYGGPMEELAPACLLGALAIEALVSYDKLEDPLDLALDVRKLRAFFAELEGG